MSTSAAVAPTNLRLDPKNLADIAGNVLSASFLRNEREQAKRLYKDLKHGKQPGMGNFVVDGQLKIPLRMGLDYSEFRGPFGFPALQTAVQALLRNLAEAIKADKPLQTFSSDEAGGSIAYGALGVIATQEGQYNVLMMAFEFTQGRVREPGLLLKLMFVDPEQFRSTGTN